MDWTQSALNLNLSLTVNEISALIQDRLQHLNRKNAVIGLSGGLDSSLTASLAVQSLGKYRVKLYYLPDVDSKPLHKQHARQLASQLDINLNILRITPVLRTLGIYKMLPLRFFPTQKLKAQVVEYGRKKYFNKPQGELLTTRLTSSGDSWIARANAYISAKHRIRMVALYLAAERARGLVIGAANKTEWLTGTFTQWGCDHCADIMPLLHLYRSQLIPLAEHLGLPKEIIRKKADPDVLPGLEDKGTLLGSFHDADLILWGLENQVSLVQLRERFGIDKVDFIQVLLKSSAHYRETPYSLL